MINYKYLSESKLNEILNNPTQMSYEDKYCDDLKSVSSAIDSKIERRHIKEIKERQNFDKYDTKIVMLDNKGNKVCSDLFIDSSKLINIKGLFSGDIFDLEQMIQATNKVLTATKLVLVDIC